MKFTFLTKFILSKQTISLGFSQNLNKFSFHLSAFDLAKKKMTDGVKKISEVGNFNKNLRFDFFNLFLKYLKVKSKTRVHR